LNIEIGRAESALIDHTFIGQQLNHAIRIGIDQEEAGNLTYRRLQFSWRRM
jgi:hypothetical protein